MHGIQQSFNFDEESREAFCSTDDQAIAAGMDRLHEMLSVGDAPLAKTSRQIALLVALCIKQMNGEGSVRSLNRRKRKAKEQVKALRELQKTLITGEASSKREVLDMDGPKFTFIFAKIMQLFGQALKGSGLDGNQAHTVMLHFGDLVKANDERLRQELNHVR